MSEPTKYHWKKHNDSNFIAGDDMQSSLNGLKPEMIVHISRFTEAESFDQNKQQKTMVTTLWLVSAGKELYKPMVLNKTNAKFWIKETGSEYVDDWLNKPVILYAHKDSRHGYVVRFRKYSKEVLPISGPKFDKCREACLQEAGMIDKVKAKYVVSVDVETALMAKA